MPTNNRQRWTNADLQNVIAYYAGKPDDFSQTMRATLTELLELRRRLGVTTAIEPAGYPDLQTKPLACETKAFPQEYQAQFYESDGEGR